jgi:sec-independent protein translocase protein TatB
MLSLPHLAVLFILALIVFGPQKLPELARMLGKATAEFRKMTNDFRYALEDEVRELDRQTRIREEEKAAAAQVTPAPVPAPATSPEGAVPRETGTIGVVPSETRTAELVSSDEGYPPPTEFKSSEPHADAVSVPHEKPPDDNSAV